MPPDPLQLVRSLNPEQRAQLEELLVKSDLGLWAPSPGPQMTAYFSEAEEIFYGGAAGGGKSALIIGLALTQHERSLILRLESTQLRGMIDDVARIIKTRDGLNKQDGQWRLPQSVTGKVNQLIEFGGVPNPGDEERHQGIPHDLLAFDEVTQLPEYIIDYLSTWNRSTNPGQRCRMVLTANPPTPSTMHNPRASNGLWIIRRYAPWLDPLYKDPYGKGQAQPGELRYFVTIDGKEREHPDPLPFFHVHKHPDGSTRKELIRPRSRTFIPARVSDNPYLAQTDYESTLQKLPEPIRSAMLYGDFSVSLSDKPLQLFPTEWVRAAMTRWNSVHNHLQQRGYPDMTSLGVDISRGGGDRAIMAPRFGNFYDKLLEIPSAQTLNGASAAAKIIEHRRAPGVVVIDANGVGASAYDHLRNTTTLQDSDALRAYVGSTKALMRDNSGRYGFTNLRSQSYWKLREALDPATPEQIALPPDDELLQELLAHTWKEVGGKIQVLPKEKVVEFLGHSPDKADAVVMAGTVYDEMTESAQETLSARQARLEDADFNWDSPRLRAVSRARQARWGDVDLPYPSRRAH